VLNAVASHLASFEDYLACWLFSSDLSITMYVVTSS
jgi:hypothetical protein